MILSFSLLSGETLRYPIEQKSITIGSSKKCDLTLPFEGISRTHLRIDFNEDGIYITDLNSLNGVFIEGKRIPKDTPTPYQTYLGLAFGSVTAVQIDFNEVTQESINSPTFDQSHDSDFTRTKVLLRAQPLTPKVPRIPKNKESPKAPGLEDRVVKFLLIILGILIIFYFKTAP